MTTFHTVWRKSMLFLKNKKHVLWALLNVTVVSVFGFVMDETTRPVYYYKLALWVYIVIMFSYGFTKYMFDREDSAQRKEEDEEHERGKEIFIRCHNEIVQILELFRIARPNRIAEVRININSKLSMLRVGDSNDDWAGDKRELSRLLGYIVSDEERILELAEKLHERNYSREQQHG